MKKYILFIVCALLLIGGESCDDLLDTKPKLEVSEDIALGDYSSLSAVMMSCYDVLQNTSYYGRDFMVIADMLADNLELANINSGRFQGHESNDEGDHVNIWGQAYSIISRCNNVLAAIDNLEDATDTEKSKLKGQALFMRAFAYFDLLRVYSREPNYVVNEFDLACPLVLQPFSFDDSEVYPKRNSVNEVYTQVEKDLGDAILLLNNEESFPYFPSKIAAKALKARVLLYQEKWIEAASLADEVIEESPVILAAAGSYIDAFKQGVESLFEMPYAIDESLSHNSLQSIFMETETTRTGYGDVIPTEGLLEELTEDGDRITMFRPALKGNQDVMYITKYNGYGGSYGVDNIALIRLSEVYLISAEAHAEYNQSGSAEKARMVLNTLRANRNLSTVDPALEGRELVEFILKERRLELAFEGHRFFDLKRKGNDILKNDQDDNLDWDDYRVVAKIPTTEIDVNTSLVQNPGY